MNLRKASEIGAVTRGIISPKDFRRRAKLGDFPPGVVVRIGRRVLFDEDALAEWIKGGGAALPGGWRRAGRGGGEAHPAV